MITPDTGLASQSSPPFCGVQVAGSAWGLREKGGFIYMVPRPLHVPCWLQLGRDTPALDSAYFAGTGERRCSEAYRSLSCIAAWWVGLLPAGFLPACASRRGTLRSVRRLFGVLPRDWQAHPSSPNVRSRRDLNDYARQR
ncbi:hypothetical protein NDU88_004544 [Pleurodeles waltl]|uniref:Uncharacterized protein n=1 Tax=Pleurodeles waltl TaxID=8319 RepID=A0AAV7MTS6_PLEWA|nr:hypothetical protein NDU88_004544 [Pleurodeles waltl]